MEDVPLFSFLIERAYSLHPSRKCQARQTSKEPHFREEEKQRNGADLCCRNEWFENLLLAIRYTVRKTMTGQLTYELHLDFSTGMVGRLEYCAAQYSLFAETVHVPPAVSLSENKVRGEMVWKSLPKRLEMEQG